MWWIEAANDTACAAHVCTDACTRVVDTSWICIETGAILGPALLAAPEVPGGSGSGAAHLGRAPSTSAKEWTTKTRFRSAAQHVIAKLFAGKKRTDVEGARADRAKTLARRHAARSIAEDVAAGRIPNIGRALCTFLTTYERTTAAVDTSVTLTVEAETRILRACVDFYGQNIQRSSIPKYPESRPTHEAIALATLYMMRDGIPGILEKNSFVAANLPDLARLKNYGYQIGRYTNARRLIQSSLENVYGTKTLQAG